MHKFLPLDDTLTTAWDFAAPAPPQPIPRTHLERARALKSSTASAGGANPDDDAFFQRLIEEHICSDVADKNPPSEAEDEILDT